MRIGSSSSVGVGPLGGGGSFSPWSAAVKIDVGDEGHEGEGDGKRLCWSNLGEES